MKLIPLSPRKALKSFLKQEPLISEIDLFKTNLIILLNNYNNNLQNLFEFIDSYHRMPLYPPVQMVQNDCF